MKDIVDRLMAYENTIANEERELVGQAADKIILLRSEITRLRALTEWRPIETAPKDGTRVWCCASGEQFSARWLDECQSAPDDYGHDAARYYTCESANLTCWRGTPSTSSSRSRLNDCPRSYGYANEIRIILPPHITAGRSANRALPETATASFISYPLHLGLASIISRG